MSLLTTHLPSRGAPTSSVHRVTASIVLTLTRVGAVGSMQTLGTHGVTPVARKMFELFQNIFYWHDICLLTKCVNDVTYSAPL